MVDTVLHAQRRHTGPHTGLRDAHYTCANARVCHHTEQRHGPQSRRAAQAGLRDPRHTRGHGSRRQLFDSVVVQPSSDAQWPDWHFTDRKPEYARVSRKSPRSLDSGTAGFVYFWGWWSARQKCSVHGQDPVDGQHRQKLVRHTPGGTQWICLIQFIYARHRSIHKHRKNHTDLQRLHSVHQSRIHYHQGGRTDNVTKLRATRRAGWRIHEPFECIPSKIQASVDACFGSRLASTHVLCSRIVWVNFDHTWYFEFGEAMTRLYQRCTITRTCWSQLLRASHLLNKLCYTSHAMHCLSTMLTVLNLSAVMLRPSDV